MRRPARVRPSPTRSRAAPAIVVPPISEPVDGRPAEGGAGASPGPIGPDAKVVVGAGSAATVVDVVEVVDVEVVVVSGGPVTEVFTVSELFDVFGSSGALAPKKPWAVRS